MAKKCENIMPTHKTHTHTPHISFFTNECYICKLNFLCFVYLSFAFLLAFEKLSMNFYGRKSISIGEQPKVWDRYRNATIRRNNLHIWTLARTEKWCLLGMIVISIDVDDDDDDDFVDVVVTFNYIWPIRNLPLILPFYAI